MTTTRYTPERITTLEPNEIFVFGSNLAGFHCAGAAKTARELFGAKDGIGVGRTGQCYALPTKNWSIKTMPLRQIADYVRGFLCYVEAHPELTFLVTPVGCGLAGYAPKDIAPLFWNACDGTLPPNVVLPESFYQFKS